MAKYATTMAELQSRVNELNKFAQTMPTVAHWLGGRYEAFYKQNNVYIEMLQKGSAKLFEDNVEKKEDGSYLTNDKTGEPECKSAEHFKAFKDGWDELMKKPITIIV